MQSFGLGKRGLSLALPCVTRAGYGKFNETETTTMYQNKVTLIGFTGAHAG
jgi:single-strand DNA-binding protein